MLLELESERYVLDKCNVLQVYMLSSGYNLNRKSYISFKIPSAISAEYEL